MVWLVEKKVFYHHLNLGFERVKIPVRVKFECEVRDGALVRGSISKSILYNKKLLEKRYPFLVQETLERAIAEKVDKEIHNYLKGCGFVREENP